MDTKKPITTPDEVYHALTAIKLQLLPTTQQQPQPPTAEELVLLQSQLLQITIQLQTQQLDFQHDKNAFQHEKHTFLQQHQATVDKFEIEMEKQRFQLQQQHQSNIDLMMTISPTVSNFINDTATTPTVTSSPPTTADDTTQQPTQPFLFCNHYPHNNYYNYNNQLKQLN